MDTEKNDDKAGVLIRRRLLKNQSPYKNIKFKVAETLSEVEGASRLVHDVYVREGYMDPQPGGLRMTAFNFLPGNQTFIGCENHNILLTVTLFSDSQNRLPMDSLYRAELDSLRSEGRVLVEVGALAVKPNAQFTFHSSVMMLFKFALLHVWRNMLVDDLVIVVNPKHRSFYEKVLSFRQIGPERVYEYVKGNPGIALRLDLKWDKKRFSWVDRLAGAERKLDKVI